MEPGARGFLQDAKATEQENYFVNDSEGHNLWQRLE